MLCVALLCASAPFRNEDKSSEDGVRLPMWRGNKKIVTHEILSPVSMLGLAVWAHSHQKTIN